MMDEHDKPDYVSESGVVYYEGGCADCGRDGLLREYGEFWICEDCWANREMEL